METGTDSAGSLWGLLSSGLEQLVRAQSNCKSSLAPPVVMDVADKHPSQQVASIIALSSAVVLSQTSPHDRLRSVFTLQLPGCSWQLQELCSE